MATTKIVRTVADGLLGTMALLITLAYSTTALAVNGATVRGIVVDPAGATAQGARIRVLDASGNVSAEAVTGADGRFQVNSPVGSVTLIVVAYGFDRFKKDLNVAEGTTADIEVKLTLDCPGEIERIIPQKLDLTRFLVEIHYWGSFGDCPEKIYRLWGTGVASIYFDDCGNRKYTATRHIEQSVLEKTLANLANDYPGPACSYYPGSLDGPRVELTIFSGDEPRLVISHEDGEIVPKITAVEQRLKKLADPEDRVKSFSERRTHSTEDTPGALVK